MLVEADQIMRKLVDEYFTGFHMPCNSTLVVGHYLWTGLAEFHTGTKIVVFFQVTVPLNPREVSIALLRSKAEEAEKLIQHFKEMPNKTGYIYTTRKRKWRKPKVRAVRGVTWFRYDHAYNLYAQQRIV